MAEVVDVFFQNDFHFNLQCARHSAARLRSERRFLVASRKRQQSDIASLLDGTGEAALMRCADASETARHDFAAFSYEALQQAHVTVRNGVDFLGAELADLLPAEKLASTGTAWATGTAGARTTSAGAG
jgi:hypothetical protein